MAALKLEMRGVMSGGAAATEEVCGLRAALEQARTELQQVCSMGG